MVVPTASLKEFPYRKSNIYICLYTLSEKRITEFICTWIYLKDTQQYVCSLA